MQSALALRKAFKAFIITIPFDSFPIIGTSVYRPLSVIPLIAIFLVSVHTKKTISLKKTTAIVFLIALSTTFIKSFSFNDYGGAIKFTVEVVFILISIISIQYTFRYYDSRNLFFQTLEKHQQFQL